MLAERLDKAWRAREATGPLDAAMRFADEGLVLGAGTVLARAQDADRDIRIEGDEARLLALLSAAHLRPVGLDALRHIRKAAERWRDRQDGLALVHLALSRLDRLDPPRLAAQRLFLADGLMQAGVAPEAILRALDLDPSAVEALSKTYDPDQPRVPAGSGRSSGQWTSGQGGGETPGGEVAAPPRPESDDADPQPRLLPVKYDARDAGAAKPRLTLSPDFLEGPSRIAPPIAGRPWFMSLTGAQLAELSLFVLRFGGPTVALGTVFIPFNKSLRQDGTINGWPPIHYIWHSDQSALVFTYLGPNLRQVTTIAELGEDGLFRDVNGKVIGRALPDGGVVIDRSAILPKETRGKDEPNLCPKATPDKNHGNVNGLLYEDYMKKLVNPENPTPSKFGIGLTNPTNGKLVMIDDCQRRSDILFEYKGPNYTKLLSSKIAPFILLRLGLQAIRQISSSEGRPLVWVFEERSAMDLVKSTFDMVPFLKNRIHFDHEPMPGFSL